MTRHRIVLGAALTLALLGLPTVAGADTPAATVLVCRTATGHVYTTGSGDGDLPWRTDPCTDTGLTNDQVMVDPVDEDEAAALAPAVDAPRPAPSTWQVDAPEDVPGRPYVEQIPWLEIIDPIPPPWLALAECESGGRWDLNVGTYDGGLQFLPSTWRAWRAPGDPDYAWQASPAAQVAAAARLRDAVGGYSPWPGCARRLGLPR